MTVFDTNFFVSLLRDRAGTLKAEADMVEHPKTTTINVYELYYGARRSMNPETSILKVDSLLKSIDILGFDKPAALKAADIQAELMDSGRPVNILDVLIAGIVMANNEEILTRDSEHFSRIKGLRWRRW